MARGGPLLAMGVGLVLLGAGAPARAPRLIWNLSSSAPPGLYLVEPGVPARLGDLAAVRPAPGLSRWLAARGHLAEGALLLKRVAAGPGQAVCRRGAGISIDGRRVAVAQARDRRGRPLPAWGGCRRLGAGEVFLLNGTADSLDGRYFGVAAARDLVGTARPLWTRGPS